VPSGTAFPWLSFTVAETVEVPPAVKDAGDAVAVILLGDVELPMVI